MVYELRKWSDDVDCLYTDDRRVMDIALRSPDLRVIGMYFRAAGERQPFAWDILGQRGTLTGITRTFENGSRRQ
jgi:hypothetical protein